MLGERERLMSWLAAEAPVRLPGLRRLRTEANPISAAFVVEAKTREKESCVAVLIASSVSGGRCAHAGLHALHARSDRPPRVRAFRRAQVCFLNLFFDFLLHKRASGGFVNWGQHCNRYEPARSYLTLAVSVGLAQPELEQALALLAKTMRERDKKSSAAQQRKP